MNNYISTASASGVYNQVAVCSTSNPCVVINRNCNCFTKFVEQWVTTCNATSISNCQVKTNYVSFSVENEKPTVILNYTLTVEYITTNKNTRVQRVTRNRTFNNLQRNFDYFNFTINTKTPTDIRICKNKTKVIIPFEFCS